MADSAPRRRKMRPLNAIAVERANRVKTKLDEETKANSPASPTTADKTNKNIPALDDDTNKVAKNNRVVAEQQQMDDRDHEVQGEPMDIADVSEKKTKNKRKKKEQSNIDTTTEKTMDKSEKRKKKKKDTKTKDDMVIDEPVAQTSQNEPDSVSNEPVQHKSKNKKAKDTEKLKEGNDSIKNKSSKKKKEKDKAPSDVLVEEQVSEKTEVKADTKQDDKERRKQEKYARKLAEKEKVNNEISKEEQKAAKRNEKQERKEKKKQQKLSVDSKRDTTHQKSSDTATDKLSTDTIGELGDSQIFFNRLLSVASENGNSLPQKQLSASDSDDTDNQKKSVQPTKKKNDAAVPTWLQNLSSSDSDDTHREKSVKPTKKKLTKSKASPPTASYLSASDSDNTDEESARPAKKKKVSPPKTNDSSASDSDDTDEESTRPTITNNRVTNKNNINFRTTSHIYDSDDDFENQHLNDVNNAIPQEVFNMENLDKIPLFKHTKKIENNRLITARRKKFDDDTNIETKLDGRFNAEFVPSVNEDFFISDSESDTDSDDSYIHPSPYRWHNEISWYARQGKKALGQEPFPKSRKFGFTDRLKLEKRIKKICRRQNMSLDDFKELTQEKISEHKKFWRMIVKVFPDRCLRHVANYCQETYNPQKSYDGITNEEIEQFKNLVQLYGEKPKLLVEKMGSTKGRVSYLLNTIRRSALPTPTIQEVNGELVKKKKRWTKDHVSLLQQKVNENKNKNGQVDFDKVAVAFEGDFTPEQCREKYRRIDGLKIKESGSLQKVKEVSPIDVLDYYKGLLQQVKKNNLKDESQLEFKKGMTGPLASWNGRGIYLKARLNIKNVEKMKIKDILESLIERQERSVAYQREEGLLEEKA
ncbi:hypothetical protein K501DRAFT_329899 [Backusella circina FSU 941]|nr:hypothetical protein K501DRAFT_329899 [Backusella circina FSU 941]